MTPHLLVVDPDPEERDGLTTSLSTLSYRVSGCADAATALALVQSDEVSLVITEHRLVGTDGQTLAQTLSRLPHPVGVVMLTRYGGPEVEERARRAGILAYLQKPVPHLSVWPLLLELALEAQAKRAGTA